ncbi:hypothetical protein IWW47_000349 [Coemansia sp. RSA 2052]|nr:hypothetical protein IWW47_000349 [Coemansia sp. RSA 2052]
MSTVSDDISSALQSLVGDTCVLSAEDLVVALSQAILLSSGFEFIDHRRAWNSPGLPQAHCAATFTCAAQPGAITEIKWVALGTNVMMLAVGLDGAHNAEHAGIKTINITTRHVVLPDAEFPFSIENAESCTASLRRVLTDDAVDKMTAAIRSQLMPDIRGSDNGAARAELAAATRLPHAQPSSSEEGEWGRPPAQGSGSTPLNPASVGRDDLNPLGRHHPFGPPDMGEGGGMVVGPGHPMFRQGGDDDGNGRPGPFGGPQALPPGAVPPGARFDPIGPFGPRPGPPRPQGGLPGRGGGGPGRLFSGEPDPDAAEPPNSNWDYYM